MALTLRPVPAPNQPARSMLRMWKVILKTLKIFFLLHVAKVRSSCEEGPGQSALSQRIMIRSWT